jgi:hypothetical protein
MDVALADAGQRVARARAAAAALAPYAPRSRSSDAFGHFVRHIDVPVPPGAPGESPDAFLRSLENFENFGRTVAVPLGERPSYQYSQSNFDVAGAPRGYPTWAWAGGGARM